MTITARLSRTLHLKLGEEGAEDMTDWMNTVDEHRAELRELNELSVARVEARIDGLEARIDGRIGEVEARLDGRIGEVEARLDGRIGQLEARLEGRISETSARLETRIDQKFAELIKWSFLFWCATVALAMLTRWGK